MSLKYVSNWNSQKVEIFSFLSLFTIVVGTHEIERREWTASEKSAWLFSFSIVWKAPLSKLGYMQNSWENIIGGCENNFLWYFQKLVGWYFGIQDCRKLNQIMLVSIIWNILDARLGNRKYFRKMLQNIVITLGPRDMVLYH